ncbi:MAG: cystathionine beta-lyase [Flavobacteriaceae bacterium]|nr:cystathionine beta-lyase [Flavobacteriaceae bacterium]|tara:strand:- start:10165 stop:11319 length:1155 start_codon:yes stop_codon:yes gene_type:complete
MIKHKLETICLHYGEIDDLVYKGAISPLYMSTSYGFSGVEQKRYPRYSNNPNQEGLGKKIAALEGGEKGLIFGSGMAAISTCLFSHLNKGDHIVFYNDLYGGTRNLIKAEFDKYGISYSFSKSSKISDFKKCIKNNTKGIYIESPSNPLLKIVDMKAISDLAKSKKIWTMIDNTFASPINQNPILFGIDIVIHSATKYLGGHSDICAGAVVSSKKHMEKIYNLSKSLGGSLSDFSAWMLERSIKTLPIRVREQNKNAIKIAEFLKNHELVSNVYYPGLPTHEDYKIAKKQMNGFGGMLSFEIDSKLNPLIFFDNLKIIKPVMSLAGIESTVNYPKLTSHSSLTKDERKNQGISDQLIRFSSGIESFSDLKDDIENALKITKNES